MDTHGIRADQEAEREATHSRALEEYGLLESEAEPELDRIEGLAAQALQAPIAFISLLGRDRHSLKARQNAQPYSVPDDLSLYLDILASEDPLVVPDLLGDPRLNRSPPAQEDPGVRFYAGTALRSRAGQLIGALHVMDVKPRTALSGADIGRLIDLAAVAMQVLEARRLKRRENAGDLAKGESERQFRILVEGISDYALYMLDPRGLVTSWNAGAEKIKGYSAEEIIGQHYSIFHTRADRDAGAPEKALRIAAEAGRFETEALRERKDGSQFWANVIVDAIRTEAGELLGYAKITRDISERRKRDEELRRLALTDTLTGVENRYSILQQIDAAVSSGPAAVLAIELDDFSKVNDFLGYEAGDRLLTDVARRMQEVVGHSGRIARVGGDEFVALLPGIADARTAVGIADSLIDALRSPFVVDDRTVSTPASVGAAVAPWHGRTASELISSSNLALHHSKSRRGGVHGLP
ncbi:MAG: diguanylate cyclase [Bauldia sp.]|nr:diguanylate cyclase [Bauldia sp.]